jgi:hypothetical protein
MDQRSQNIAQSRIELDEKILDRFFKEVFHGGISDLAVEKHLPYSLIYNLAKGRIRSLSARDYRIIFGEEPLPHEQDRVEGTYFRKMVDLWLYLNDSATKSGLYREYYPDKDLKKIDYRKFTGEVKTVEARLERFMEQKFLDEGFDRSEIKEAIEELDLIPEEERVPYEDIRPLLEYLEAHSKVSPAQLLAGHYHRYEQGELKTVTKSLFDYARKLKKEVEKALNSGKKSEIEILRERIYGKREGLTLYAQVKDQLEFLQNYGGKRPNRYLGRSIARYEKSELKRIASWRARKIRKDYNALIDNSSELPIRSIPKAHLEDRLGKLLSILKAFRAKAMTQQGDMEFERSILSSVLAQNPGNEPARDILTRLERAPYALKMNKRAFDLMVAGNSDIFKKIGHYDGRWYLPTHYLQKLSKQEGFDVVKEKYEFIAKTRDEASGLTKKTASVSPEQSETTAPYTTGQGTPHHRESGIHTTDRKRFRSSWTDFRQILPSSKNFLTGNLHPSLHMVF